MKALIQADQITFTLKNRLFPLKKVFRIAHGARTEASVLELSIYDGVHSGWAEVVPYIRYGESISSVSEQIKQFFSQNRYASDLEQQISLLPAGSARNALDCALWDLKAKQTRKNVAELLKLPSSEPFITAQTLSIDSAGAMANAIKKITPAPLIKIKLDNEGIIEKIRSIHQASPNSQFIVDANESWSLDDLAQCVDDLKAMNVILIEQPLPADVVNIKLDKTGGLTEALNLAQQAEKHGFEIMLGCMVGSSLAMAPIALLAPLAKYVDLDGPLLISQDRENGLLFDQGYMSIPAHFLWGNGGK
jgi:L-alanine-DL-glutamate epimerase-like enolase superfamily enzyme